MIHYSYGKYVEIKYHERTWYMYYYDCYGTEISSTCFTTFISYNPTYLIVALIHAVHTYLALYTQNLSLKHGYHVNVVLCIQSKVRTYLQYYVYHCYCLLLLFIVANPQVQRSLIDSIINPPHTYSHRSTKN